MKTLDEILADKTIAILHYMISRIIKPDMVLDKVAELDENQNISCAHKPLKINFLKVCKEMNVQLDKVLVIEDSLFDDVREELGIEEYNEALKKKL